MEPIFENRDEEERLRRRAERIERMRREKELQRKRRQLIRMFLPIGAIAIVVIIIVVVAVTTLSKKPGTENFSGQNAQVGSAGGTETMQNTTGQGDVANGTADGSSQQAGGMTGATPEPTEAPTPKPTEAPLYSFETTDDTVTIYSEEVISTHGILVDVSTDTIVASKGAFERICPASMTKVLTVLVAAEQITKADLDDTFTMTLEITDYAYVNDCSSVGFLNEEVVTVRDLFYGTVLPSGGDAAVGLATYIAGSHEAFVDMMNEKLEELGLSETAHFTNCVGLYDKEHYCTVYDMAVIMKAAMENELCREFLSAHTYTTTPTPEHPEGIIISNWFLRRIEDKDTGGEVIGAKTGYVVQSGSCAVSYGTFGGGTPYICVTAGSSSSWRCIYDQVEIFNRYVPAGE